MKTTTTTTKTTTATIIALPTFSAQQHALAIPEILEHIFSFLTRQDRTRRARRVCKRWSAICKDPVSYTWTLRVALNDDDNNNRNFYNREDDEQTQVIRISLADHVTIRVDTPSEEREISERRLASWTRAMDLLSKLMDDCKSSGKCPRLQSLYLTAGVLQNFVIQLRQLPSLTTLTTLRITMCLHYNLAVLFTACRACPNIEELVFQGTQYDTSAYPYFFEGPPSLFWLEGSYVLPTLHRLQTCILHYPSISVERLEEFLQASPNLARLVLFRVTYTADPRRFPTIATHVAAHCPNLRSFHLSMFDGVDDVNDRELTSCFSVIPNLDEFSAVDEEFYVRRMWFRNVIRTVANRITTLNILPGSYRMMLIRDVLCTFEHLVHLRAPDVSRYIWACRGLKTLHMTVASDYQHSFSPEATLTVFGFLSRMCPLLEELYLTRLSMDLSFQGGLCLLTRLQHLERIWFVASNDPGLNSRALFWIRQTPTALSTWNRHLTCGIQRLWLLKRRAKYFGVLHPDAAATRPNATKLGQELGMDLSKIGHPDDLLEWMDERYGRPANDIGGDDHDDEKDEDVPPLAWPKLESFWVGSQSRHKSVSRTEKFLTKVRPNVEFDLGRKSLHPRSRVISQLF
ncbi:hypothetical protein BGZ95_007551 [Linnemannia exigua]|uniref:F-box domain-containing protein n=1 Tax=Linnemannia exigua TaxID=604196 RepID=A0AAD4DH56_9FUNG|nr:hypothetical protein BGZ95_007551 [Linnemannia exigua]